MRSGGVVPGGGAYPAGPPNSGLGPGFGPGLGPGLGPGPGGAVPPAPPAPPAPGAVPPPPPLPGECSGAFKELKYFNNQIQMIRQSNAFN